MDLFNTISIALTIFFGLLAIFAYVDQKRFKYSIFFGLLESYSFIKKSDNIDVKLSHRNTEYDNAFVLKTELSNSGKNDIDNSKIKKPISIILPDDYKWIDFAISDEVNLPEASATKINDNEIMLTWELLKSGESIKTEAFVTSKNVSETKESITAIKFFNDIKLDYRISNIRKIRKTQPKEQKKKRLLFLLYLAVLGCMLILTGIPGLFPIWNRYEIKYGFELKGDTTNTYSISPKSATEIVLFNNKDLDTPLKRINNFIKYDSFTTKSYSISDFNKIEKKVIVKSQKNKPILAIIYIVVGMLSLFYVVFYVVKKIVNVNSKIVIS